MVAAMVAAVAAGLVANVVAPVVWVPSGHRNSPEPVAVVAPK